ncbi:unnamed protein product [Vicia faba]|uniref:Cysteine-rich receptor-like protein kinase n=1 Tax=Vicia faba TaxID=3906 RepID=A0AAV1B5C2_VICFA|nr:unnamed protein product [Vicia faba]
MEVFSGGGWGGFVLKEKLRLIKGRLRWWHQQHSQNLERKISQVNERIKSLDVKVEQLTLEEGGEVELHDLSVELLSLSKLNSSIQWQKSRVNWLREGDAKSKSFHGVMASRRRSNAIIALAMNNHIVEGVAPIKEAIFQHFLSHFRATVGNHPKIDNLAFKSLSVEAGADLVKQFQLEELKQAVWDCDSYKSPGPDGLNFGTS